MYAGYQYDEESKYYNLHARYYDPQTARFLQQDTYRGTIVDPLSLNLYTYCHNEPMMYYDPTGHSEKSALDLIGDIIAAKEIYEEEQKWRDGLWPVDPRRNFRTKAQKEAASSAETARSSLKSTEAYEDPTLKQAIDSYLEKEYGGTMEDVLDLQKTIWSYNSLINEKNRIANQKSMPSIEPQSNEGTGNTYLTLEQMKSLGWSKIHCGYVTIDTGEDSPLNDMTSEIGRKYRDLNQGDIDKINTLFDRYQINTKKRIAAFFAECSAETANGTRFLEGAGTRKNPFVGSVTRTNLNWDFFQNQILGMNWLNDVVGSGLSALELDIDNRWVASAQFFIYDTIKIVVLLCVLIFIISYNIL